MPILLGTLNGVRATLGLANYSGTAAEIISVPAQFRRGGSYTIPMRNAGTSQGSSTVSYGGVAIPVTAWADSGPTIRIPAEIGLLHNTYTLSIQIQGLGTVTADVPLMPAAGQLYTIIGANPIVSSASIFFQMVLTTGAATTPEQNGQIVFAAKTFPNNRDVVVYANGYVKVDFKGEPITRESFPAYYIDPDGSIGRTVTVYVDDLGTPVVTSGGIILNLFDRTNSSDIKALPVGAQVTLQELQVLSTHQATVGANGRIVIAHSSFALGAEKLVAMQLASPAIDSPPFVATVEAIS